MEAKTREAAMLADDSYRAKEEGKIETIDGIEYKIIAVADQKSGFQAVAYQRQDTGAVIIAYRGTEFDREPFKDGVIADGHMVLKGVNTQYDDAVAFTEHAIALAKASEPHFKGPVAISITGHSLGGTLTQLMCHRYNLPGITFNAYGAAGLGYKLPEGGSLVQNHVVATDLVSAASPHFGEVHVYMSERDAAMLKRGRYIDHASSGIGANPFLTSNIDAHRMGNFLPVNPFHGTSIISRENELRAKTYAVEVNGFRGNVMEHRLTAAACARKLLTNDFEICDAQALGTLVEHAREAALESDPVKNKLAKITGYKDAATRWMHNLLSDTKHAIVDTTNRVSDAMDQATDHIKQKVSDAGHAIVDTANRVSDAMDQTTDHIKQKVSDAGHAIVDTTNRVSHAMDQATDNVKHQVQQTVSHIKQGAQELSHQAGVALDSAIEGTAKTVQQGVDVTRRNVQAASRAVDEGLEKLGEGMHKVLHPEKPMLLLNDPAHPDRQLYQQAFAGVKNLDVLHRRPTDHHSEQLAAGLVVLAREQGMTRIDKVMLSPDLTQINIIQGNESWVSNSAITNTNTTARTPIQVHSQAWKDTTPEPVQQQLEQQEQERLQLSVASPGRSFGR
ncbi:XVIPCD domain-containing protein [Dyella sp.]|uniref:XVIPCD domain-containing protein n=1 Tax=Dyella sp. TaxID=1869338 RepID=UPI002ED59EA6